MLVLSTAVVMAAVCMCLLYKSHVGAMRCGGNDERLGK